MKCRISCEARPGPITWATRGGEVRSLDDLRSGSDNTRPRITIAVRSPAPIRPSDRRDAVPNLPDAPGRRFFFARLGEDGRVATRFRYLVPALFLLGLAGCDSFETSGPIVYRDSDRMTRELAAKPK